MPRSLALLLLCAAAMVTADAVARDPYVPPELESWREWVLDGDPRLACPVAGGQDERACLWPGRLSVAIGARGGRFDQRVEVLAPSWFVVPGDVRTWPQQVTVDGNPAAVTEREGRPAIYLEVGRYRVGGAFVWGSVPDTLGISALTGLIALEVDRRSVAHPRWDGRVLWTGATPPQAAEQTQNRLSVTVYRTIVDGAPAFMDMTLQIDVAGESREEVIGRLVPEGFAPASMTSPLPARLDSDGQLRIQARPGSWTLTFRARTSGPLRALTFSPAGEHWPAEEIWSYRADPALRVTEATAANPVDPQQTGVPPAAVNLPAYRMRAGDTLTIEERQRGRAPTERDRLSLTRELWLDFDRGGYTAKDTLRGEMLSGWRLDLAAPLTLQSAALGSDVGSDGLLVTANPQDDTLRGVEVRTPHVEVTALSRLDGDGGRLPVSGWQSRLQDVTTTLYLPPGTRLLYAAGADGDAWSWVNRWNLLHFFLLLITAAAVWRMTRPALGILALVALTLSMHEPGAPLWTWVSLIAAIALCRALPAGRARRAATLYKYLSVAVLVVAILPFATQHLRLALYPQLELGVGGRVASRPDLHMPAPMARDEGVVAITKQARERVAAVEDEVMVTGSRLPGAEPPVPQLLNRYASNAQVQTGPGAPNWRWRPHYLTWGGPVTPEQTVRLWIAPPWAMSLWRLAMVGLVVGLLAGLLRSDRAPKAPVPDASSAAAVFLAIGLAGIAAVPAPPAEAQMPTQALLEELKSRLSAPPVCVPQCVAIERATIRYTRDALQVDLIAHAQTDATLALPGASNGWYATDLRIDGQASDTLRMTHGQFQTRLAPGVHRLSLRGALPAVNTVTLAFPQVPHQVSVEGDGWEATGLSDGRLSGGALTLIRQRDADAAATLAAIDVEQFPAFVTVQRTLNIDLDWTMTTVVVRNTPPTAAINLRIPLLTNEAVTSDEVTVEDGAAVVNLATGQNRIAWTSALTRQSPLVLEAASEVPWQERWQVNMGASWHLAYRGVPEDNTDVLRSPIWTAAFTPWPGESLTLTIERPAAVEGPTLAIDSARVTRSVGRRASESTLALDYRASQGGQHAIALPQGSELIGVVSDGRALHLSAQDGRLRLPVLPGRHQVQVNWRDPAPLGPVTRTEDVDLGSAASNLATSLMLPHDRWVLWTDGPRLGPAVLYWSELLALVLVAFALARLVSTPLKFRHWLLLGLGFSTFYWPSFAIVAAAILALWLRERFAPDNAWAFNLVQLGLAALVLAAAGALVSAIPMGLLGSPDMHIVGNGSSAAALEWFVDRSDGTMPRALAVSLPLWVYKGLILVWALWLAFALLRWLPWMWKAFTAGGYWRPLRAESDATPSTQA